MTFSAFPLPPVLATPRTRGRKWMRLRGRVLMRDPLCTICISSGRVHASTVVDHIVPLVLGGKDDESNLRGLCTDCHDAVTREQFGYQKRKAFSADGLPIGDEWL